MTTFDLNGTWNLYFAPGRKGVTSDPESAKAGMTCIQATVPGNVELDLCAAGIEEDPFLGLNIYSYRKYEFYDWMYERSFTLPESFDGKETRLRLHGLDTYGTVWLNGVRAGRTDNALIEHELDLTSLLRPGENTITVYILSAMNTLAEMDFPVLLKGCEHTDELTRVRKPAHSFGWDIMPRLLSAGLWRSVELAALEPVRIKEVYYATKELGPGYAVLSVRFRFETDDLSRDGYSVRVRGVCGESTFEKKSNLVFVSDHMHIRVDDPALWWPAGYGEPALYDVTCELLLDGEVVDSRAERVGLRKVEIITRYDPGDMEFMIKCNGWPVMAKGSNWVPLDVLHSRDPARLPAAMELARDIGCNILRCWGGNVYEDHAFYDLCDENGIMVWQDFSLACAIYPQEQRFFDTIEHEAAVIIRKLRNHTCIILWAGDNEIDDFYSYDYAALPYSRHNAISREVLPRAVGMHDPFRFYLPSSPYIPDGCTRSLDAPEQHNWGPRDYFKGDFYRLSTAHFISEIGYHGCPSVDSLKRFLSPDKLWPYRSNDEWDTHNTDYLRWEPRGYNRNELMAEQVRILFGYEPGDLETFSLASQISQAEAKKFFIEMVRTKKWRRTGIIWWNLLDGWPQISDAVVDYYFDKKLAYHYIKRSMSDVCIMLEEAPDRFHNAVLANDSRKTVLVKYTVEDGETGDVCLQGEALSPANENISLGSCRYDPGGHRFFIMRWSYGGREYANHYISGGAPYDFERYKGWLDILRGLPDVF